MTIILDCIPIMIPVKLILKLPSHMIFLDPGASPTPKNMALVNIVRNSRARQADRRRTLVNELRFGRRKIDNQIWPSMSPLEILDAKTRWNFLRSSSLARGSTRSMLGFSVSATDSQSSHTKGYSSLLFVSVIKILRRYQCGLRPG